MAPVTNSEKLIASYIKQIQDLEQALFELINERTLTSAIGSQLDGSGSLVGENRNGRDDADYRRAIEAKILINTSSGTLEQMVAIVRKLIPEDRTLVVSEDSFPAHFEIDVPVAIEFLPGEVTTSAAAPFVLADGLTLDVEVDGGATQVVTFNAVDFVDITTATADEVAAKLSADLAGAGAARVVSRVTLASDSIGPTSSIEITGGTALGILSFITGIHTGADAAQLLMEKVAIAMQTARGNSIRGILLWSTSSTSFGFAGTSGALGFGAGEFSGAS